MVGACPLDSSRQIAPWLGGTLPGFSDDNMDLVIPPWREREHDVFPIIRVVELGLTNYFFSSTMQLLNHIFVSFRSIPSCTYSMCPSRVGSTHVETD